MPKPLNEQQMAKALDKVTSSATMEQPANFAEPPWHLLKSFIPENEINGWMYMGEVKNTAPYNPLYKETHPTYHEFKHGISRYGLGISGHSLEPRIIKGDPTIHYARLDAQKESPTTPYNEKYIRNRNKRLFEAGWNVTSGEVG